MGASPHAFSDEYSGPQWDVHRNSEAIKIHDSVENPSWTTLKLFPTWRRVMYITSNFSGLRTLRNSTESSLLLRKNRIASKQGLWHNSHAVQTFFVTCRARLGCRNTSTWSSCIKVEAWLWTRERKWLDRWDEKRVYSSQMKKSFWSRRTKIWGCWKFRHLRKWATHIYIYIGVLPSGLKMFSSV
jgi:hypothetical protein